MPDMDEYGWVPWHRRTQNSPVWRKPKAFILFFWLVQNAAPRARIDHSSGRDVALARGQVYASLAQAAEACPLSVKEIRNAFTWLEKEEMIQRDSGSSVITIVKYEEYQVGKKDESPHREEREERIRAEGQGNGHRNGQGENKKKGKASTSGKPLRDKWKTEIDSTKGARKKSECGQGNGHRNGQAHNKEVKEVSRSLKKTTNPPTPFCKGGAASDSSALLGAHEERVAAVLAEWRKGLEAAGLSTLEGKRCRSGAELLVDEYLENAAMSMDTLRGGIKNLVHLIATDPACAKYDLRTLANNPRKYCPAPVIMREKKRLVLWRFVCDVCGNSACTPYTDAALGTPLDQPCNAGGGCQGTMHPTKDDEIER